MHNIPESRVYSLLNLCKYNWGNPSGVNVTGVEDFCSVVRSWCTLENIPCNVVKKSGSRTSKRSSITPRRYARYKRVMTISTHLVCLFDSRNNTALDCIVNEAIENNISCLDAIIIN